jgi:hypothetical protein
MSCIGLRRFSLKTIMLDIEEAAKRSAVSKACHNEMFEVVEQLRMSDTDLTPSYHRTYRPTRASFRERCKSPITSSMQLESLCKASLLRVAKSTLANMPTEDLQEGTWTPLDSTMARWRR